MAPKAPEKSPQQQPLPSHGNETTTVAAVVPKHSNPFYISAHTLCHNKRLKQKRSKYQEIFRNAAASYHQAAANNAGNKNKTESIQRRQKLSLLRPEITIDLLSDGEDNDVAVKRKPSAFQGKMCLERAAILGLMPVVRLTNGQQRSPPPLVPLMNGNRQKKLPMQKQNNMTSHRKSLQLTHQPPPSLSTPQQQQLQRQQQQQQLQSQSRKRKSRPHKRHSLPILLNTESIVLSDDSDTEQTTNGFVAAYQQSPIISSRPDLAIIYPTNQSSPCQQAITIPVPVPSSPADCSVISQNTIQVDEDVTISLVPRSLTATTCARSSRTSLNSVSLVQNTSMHIPPAGQVQDQQPTPPPPFPMLPDETTVHTVIANRIYELSLTKLREGLASCGIPEFNDGQQKISPPRRKGTVQPPPMLTQPQTPISLKLSSDLSISLISDDEDDVRHHQTNEPLLSPAYLQKLPANVSIAPVVSIMPHPTTPSSVVAADPRKLKFG
ncbi:protein a6 [Stomoxys calcitrans]|uniref:protein a6 n=1 Tax=Stomoxys calcitrans TaxID=35570 RepID=UPI0027E21CBF|nr:protein a6 [Stomoxys calcitrans]